VLAQIDPQDYKLAVDAARAALTAAVTNRDLAAADLSRFQGLKEQNFISAAELERREAALKAAQAQVSQAQAQLSSLGNQVGYANLVADTSGVVLGVDAEVGQMVAVGTPVLRLAHDGARDVVFSVPEDKIASVKLGAPFAVRSWDGALPARTGKVREVAASADPVTRTYQVKLALDAGNDWPLGATVYVQRGAAALADRQVIKLPTSALVQTPQGSTQVWLFDAQQMTVKPVPVVVSGADGNDAVIASGLKPGDRVVSAGVHVLTAGLKVTVYQDK
jgi:membrane fusion protein, multidrug efflux system